MTRRFRVVGEVTGDPADLMLYVEGWQSWSRAGLFAATDRPAPAWPTLGGQVAEEKR